MEEKEKVLEELEAKQEDKPKSKNWLEELPIWAKFVGGALAYFFIKDLAETGMSGILGLAFVLAILYSIGKNVPDIKGILDSREAESMAELELSRKLYWEQFPIGTKFSMSPINNMIHRSARGMFRVMNVAVLEPYMHLPYYLDIKVMASGPERGHVSVLESYGKPTGREMEQEKDVWPEMFKFMKKSRTMENWGRKFA